jgi:serine/threonine-protein kinase
MIGALLDQRYQVVRVLGQGGFGHTYIAEDTRRPGNPTCVVKHLKPASSDPEFLQIARRLFTREAETLEKLGTHDQIPRLLAYFEENQEFYLVEEFIDGHPLNVELQPGQQWSESLVIQLLQEVLQILEFVHSNGVIHRDLKPENLIRRKHDNKIVLVDFGAVKQVQMQSIVAQEVVKETVAIGTPGYMPSEQGQGRPRTSSDIYALGMIGIQALTGMNPTQFSEDPDTGEIIWQQQAQVSDSLAAVLTKMVRHYFKYRYQSAAEALQAIEPLANPNAAKAFAAIASQRVSHYLRGSYQSASKALQTLQNLSGIKTRQAIATLKSLPSGRASAPSSNLMEETATVHPGNQLRSPVGSGSFSSIPNKLSLIIGASTATLVIIAVALSVIRKPSPSVVATGNQTNLASEPNQTNSTPNSNPSKSKPDPNKSDSTSEPNQTNSTPDPDKSKDPNNCTFVMSRSSNVRESAKSKKTGKVLEAGTQLTVTGKEQDGWIEISSPQQGWVWKSRTKKTCPSSKSDISHKKDDSSKKND